MIVGTSGSFVGSSRPREKKEQPLPERMSRGCSTICSHPVWSVDVPIVSGPGRPYSNSLVSNWVPPPTRGYVGGCGAGGRWSGPPHYEEGIQVCCFEVETQERRCVHGVTLPAYRGFGARGETEGKRSGKGRERGKETAIGRQRLE